MIRNKLLRIASALGLCFALNSTVSAAFFYGFEDGTDGAPVNNLSGVIFQDFNGYTSLYGDSSTGGYNTTSDDLGYGTGSYHHNGDFFLWAGSNADARGVIIDFANNDGTWFQTGYSSQSVFYVEAHLTDGTVVTAQGDANLNTPMDFLTVYATANTFIDYIVLHDSGNYWLIDDISGDTTGVNTVPLPAAVWLFGSGLVGLLASRRKKKQSIQI